MIANNKNPLRRWALTILVFAGAVIGISQITSCASPGYYWQATTGHLALMHARQPVSEAIESGNLDESTTSKLELSREIIKFATEELGLPDNDSYSEYVETGRDAVVWNVVAAPEFSLQAKQWCFPVAGCVPYRGYFKQASAEKFAGKLSRKDLEVSVSPATAYSTLGWFEDPLLDTMLNRSDAQFAALIFHELAHQQLYVKGDTRFNESYASFVESIGVRLWLEERGQQEIFERWQKLGEAEKSFTILLQQTRDELQEIYRSGAPPEELRARKQETFERMLLNYRETVADQWEGRDYFGGWFARPLNNARFALLDSYQGGNCAFHELFAEAGENIIKFHALAQVKSELPDGERKQWLEQPCSGIAPDVEL